MKIMYVAPRYHTNQIPIMKGWIEAGHEVCFISQYAGKLEDYSHVTPVILGYSPLFRIFEKVGERLIKNESRMGELRFKCGFPPLGSLKKRIKEFQPDVVILRERSVYSICCHLICRRLHVPTIMYNQSPLWEKEIKTDAAHRLVKGLTPKMRITPVLGDEKKHSEKEEYAFYVPFVMEGKTAPEERTYFEQERINIFTIGKYEKRKNQQMMIEIVEELSKKYPIHLTIAGECTTQSHKDYYRGVETYVKENGLESQVTLLKNLTRQQVDAIYEKTDLFVIPSTLEPASISQLEAMAYAIPVICSDTNGTACYVENGRNGFQFKDNNAADLKEKVEDILRDRQRLLQMGKESYLDIMYKYSFKQYKEALERIMQQMHDEGI